MKDVFLIIIIVGLISCTSVNFNPLKTPVSIPLKNDDNAYLLSVKQIQDTDCSVASLAGVLSYWGSPITQEEIKDSLGLVPRNGYSLAQLKSFVTKNGFIAYILQGDYEILKYHTDLNRPVIIILKSGAVRNHSMIVNQVFWDGSEFILNAMDPETGEFNLYSSKDIDKAWSALGNPLFLIGKKT